MCHYYYYIINVITISILINSPITDSQVSSQRAESSTPLDATEDTDEDFNISGLSRDTMERGALLLMPNDKENARRRGKPSDSLKSPERCATRLDIICHAYVHNFFCLVIK